MKEKKKNEKPVAILFIIVGLIWLGNSLLNGSSGDEVSTARLIGRYIGPILLLFAGGVTLIRDKGK